MNNNENKPRNNLVAESDLQACLKGIQSCLQDPKYASTEQSDENGSQVLTTLLVKAQESLFNRVERLVEPISDEAYHQHLQINIVKDDEEEEDTSDEESEEEALSDDEYHEDELVDQKILQRARVLRQQVREASERVGKLRHSVTGRAVSVAQREAALLVGPPTNPGKPYRAEEVAQRFEQPFMGTKSEKLVEMEESLKNLSTFLQEMDDKVPDTMETFQETIDTIQTAMEQDPQSLSQTERAIRSRSNEGPSMSQKDSNKAPEARLGSFLGQH